jgi:hypothetical protein
VPKHPETGWVIELNPKAEAPEERITGTFYGRKATVLSVNWEMSIAAGTRVFVNGRRAEEAWICQDGVLVLYAGPGPDQRERAGS